MIIVCRTCGTERESGEVCRPCANRRNAAYKLRNADVVKAKASAYKKRKHAEGAAERLAKKEAKRATFTERKRAAQRKWKTANRHKVVADCAMRGAAKIRATPEWANRKEIDEAYRHARLMTAEFAKVGLGIKFHVDHIVPLRGKTVCGLHVEDNLRVVPDFVNMKKGNREWPDSSVNDRDISPVGKPGWDWLGVAA